MTMHTRTRRTRRLGATLAAVTAISALAVTGIAVAAGGNGGGATTELTRLATMVEARNAFEADVAKRLGTTEAKLAAAIEKAALARVDAAVKSGTLTQADADVLRDAIAAGELPVRHLARATDVAGALGVTTAELNGAYAAAHETQALARVDAALAAGDLTEAQAEELRAEIEDATFPGFAGPGHGARGGRPGHHGPGGPGSGAGLRLTAAA